MLNFQFHEKKIIFFFGEMKNTTYFYFFREMFVIGKFSI